ncbi:MAG TPA: glycosyltransferase family 87 protein [Herpetosiphonaceae bacterium]|nr:glycosyltransferase family 87 protein [Herpetosiphonaceae bacterium]
MTGLPRGIKVRLISLRTYGGELCAVLMAALLALAVLIAAYRFTPAIAVAVGEQDTGVYRDLHALESAGSMTYRWTTGTSRLTLPQVGDPGGGVLALAVWTPEEQPPNVLTVAVRDAPLITTEVHGVRTLTLLVPASVTHGGDLAFDLRASLWQTRDDPRLIGVAVRRISWRGLGPALPPLRQLWLLPVLVVLLAGVGRRLGYRMPAALGVATVIGLGLALGAAHWPLEVAPYVHRLVLIALLTHTGLLLWSALIGRGLHSRRLPEEVGPVALVVMLGIGHWLMLPYQWALCAEVGPAVCPRPGLQVIGPLVLGIISAVGLTPTIPARARRNIVLGTLALGSLAAGVYAISFALGRSGPDFFIHWRAAYNFHLGRPLYDIAAIKINHFGHAFKLPPFDAMIYLPFATADDTKVLLGQRILNILLYLTSGGLLISFIRRRLGWATGTAAVVVVMGLLQPAFDTIAYGQTDILVLLLLVTVLLALRHGWSWLAGAALALGIIIKLYLLLWIGFLILRRRWAALAWTAVTFVLLNSLAIGVMGWHNHLVFLREVLPHLGGGTSWVENQTINGFLSRLLTDTLHTDPIRDPLINLLTIAAFGGITGLTMLLAGVPTDSSGSSFMLQFSSLAVVMPLAIPAAWMHYETSIVLPLVALVWHVVDHPLPRRRAFWVALAFGLIAFGNQWSFFNGTRHPGLPELGLSYKGFGLVLLWLVTLTSLAQALNVNDVVCRLRSRLGARRPQRGVDDPVTDRPITT